MCHVTKPLSQNMTLEDTHDFKIPLILRDDHNTLNNETQTNPFLCSERFFIIINERTNERLTDVLIIVLRQMIIIPATNNWLPASLITATDCSSSRSQFELFTKQFTADDYVPSAYWNYDDSRWIIADVSVPVGGIIFEGRCSGQLQTKTWTHCLPYT